MCIYNSKIRYFSIDGRELLFRAQNLLAAQNAAIAVVYTE